MKTAAENKLSEAEKLVLAQQAFREFHTQCFWYLRKDLPLTPADLPEVARGLRLNGGRRGFQLAETFSCR
ncbi:MAG: hypothetical protein WCH61_10175 [bacterium]